MCKRGVDGFGGGSVDVCGNVGIDAADEEVEVEGKEGKRVPPHCGVNDAVYMAFGGPI